MTGRVLRADIAGWLNDLYASIGYWISMVWGWMVDATHIVVKYTIGFITPEPPTRDTAQLFLIGILFVVGAVIVMAKKLFEK